MIWLAILFYFFNVGGITRSVVATSNERLHFAAQNEASYKKRLLLNRVGPQVVFVRFFHFNR
jgi:hypothetical protein